MEQELDARTRELNRTQEELVTSNQILSDLNRQLEELQRQCSTLEEQRFSLGLWGLWERCWCTIAVAHPHVPIAPHSSFWSQCCKGFWICPQALHAIAALALSLASACVDTRPFRSCWAVQSDLSCKVIEYSKTDQNSLLRPWWSSCFWKPKSFFREINLVSCNNTSSLKYKELCAFFLWRVYHRGNTKICSLSVFFQWRDHVISSKACAEHKIVVLEQKEQELQAFIQQLSIDLEKVSTAA